MNQTTSHIEFEKIIDFIQDKFNETERAEIAEHLAACAMCAMQRKRLELTLETMSSDKMEDVPVYLSERIFDMFDLNFASPQAEKTSVREKILAALQFDRFVPAFGLRSLQSLEVRKVRFTAKDYMIDMQISQTHVGEWRISGEIFGEAIGGEVELESEKEKRRAEINDFSEFSFEGIKTGKYNLSVRLENCEIAFPELIIEH